MRILVCVKRVPAPGARIVLTPDARAIDTSLLGFAISPHEECAVEEAVQITERLGGSVTVLTLGPDAAAEQVRSAVAVGASEGVLLQTDLPDWDPVSTARALTAAISEMETETRPFDLIFFGNESADSGGYQVGIRVARALKRPMVTGIKRLDTETDAILARRQTPSGWEVYRLPLPAAVGIKEGINLPRYPTLRGRLAARRAEIQTMSPVEGASGQSMVKLVTPPDAGSTVRIVGEGAGAAPAVVDILGELGLV